MNDKNVRHISWRVGWLASFFEHLWSARVFVHVLFEPERSMKVAKPSIILNSLLIPSTEGVVIRKKMSLFVCHKGQKKHQWAIICFRYSALFQSGFEELGVQPIMFRGAGNSANHMVSVFRCRPIRLLWNREIRRSDGRSVLYSIRKVAVLRSSPRSIACEKGTSPWGIVLKHGSD